MLVSLPKNSMLVYSSLFTPFFFIENWARILTLSKSIEHFKSLGTIWMEYCYRIFLTLIVRRDEKFVLLSLGLK